MTSGTDELRRMLDERGVEWHDTKIGKGFITVYEYDGITWIVTEHSSGRLSVKGCVKPTQGHYDGMTPAQAIAATLGTGTCHNVNHGLTFVCSECGANVDTASSIGYSYVDEFGKRWYGASNDYGLNYCPNCGRKVVAE